MKFLHYDSASVAYASGSEIPDADNLKINCNLAAGFSTPFAVVNVMLCDLPDLKATVALGRQLAAHLFPGAVIGLIGPLGAGKTHLVRAIAEGLGADPRAISSPTFVLVQEYPARLPLFHFDAYRLQGAGAFFDLGAHEYFESQGVSLVEWADRVVDCLPREYLRITLCITGETSRSAEIVAVGERYETLVACIV